MNSKVSKITAEISEDHSVQMFIFTRKEEYRFVRVLPYSVHKVKKEDRIGVQLLWTEIVSSIPSFGQTITLGPRMFEKFYNLPEGTYNKSIVYLINQGLVVSENKRNTCLKVNAKYIYRGSKYDSLAGDLKKLAHFDVRVMDVDEMGEY